MFRLIQQQTDLNDIINLMCQYSVFGLDTEFIKVDTLWPKLGVFQVNINGQVYLLDGTVLDLSAFWQQIFKAKQNIFHACSEDIDLIYHYSKNKHLANVFDTQVGLSFLGHGLQVSYQNALKTMLNIDIEKDQTRSDWLARPLTQEQLNYAANDVLYIMQLSEKIQQQLAEKQLLSFVEDDCKNLTLEIGQQTPEDLLYTDVGNYRHSSRQLMQLQQLATWREKLAMHLNQPRSFILKNATMIDLVEHNPKNSFQLSHIKQLRPNIIREYGKEILTLLRDLPANDTWPKRLARPIRHSSNEMSNQIEMTIEQIAFELQIPKEVLMRKKWMNALYQHVVFKKDEQDLPSYLLGWRYELLTQPLLKILNKESGYLSAQMKVVG